MQNIIAVTAQKKIDIDEINLEMINSFDTEQHKGNLFLMEN